MAAFPVLLLFFRSLFTPFLGPLVHESALGGLVHVHLMVFEELVIRNVPHVRLL